MLIISIVPVDTTLKLSGIRSCHILRKSKNALQNQTSWEWETIMFLRKILSLINITLKIQDLNKLVGHKMQNFVGLKAKLLNGFVCG